MSDHIQKVSSEVLREIGDLRREAGDAYQQLVIPQNATHSFHQTLYGYVQRVFSFVDLLSSYWSDERVQSTRMVAFMETYFGANRRAHGIAVQMWRHKLFHTARPRNLRDPTSGSSVRYMIQWHNDRMSSHQRHYTTTPFMDGDVLNIACLSLIDDLERAARAYFAAAQLSPALQAQAAAFEATLDWSNLKSL